MKTKIISVLLVLFFVLINASSLKATHLAGGSITYNCLSSNNYAVTITLYRDCRGIALASPSLTIKACGNIRTVPYTGGNPVPVLVTPPCNSTVKTACDVPAGTAPGIQRLSYIFNVTLTSPEAACNDVGFLYNVGSRSSTVTILCTAGSENIYLEAHLNPTVGCFSSPVFSIEPVLFLCLNQQNSLDCSANPGADSLSYSLVCPKKDSVTCVTYCAGFDQDHFLTGTITFNSTTGMLVATPTVSNQVSVYSVKITQRRFINGVWTITGSIIRDVQIYMINCANNQPTLTGIDGTNNYSASTCPGSTFCFDVYSNDADAADSLTLTSVGSPPFIFTVSGGKHPTGHFCLHTVLSDSGKTYCCAATVRDNACHQMGSTSGNYCISVVAKTLIPVIYESNDTIRCTYTSATTYQWYFNGSPKGGNYPWIPFDSTGSYYVVVTDGICSGTSNIVSFTVGIIPLQNEKLVAISPNPFSKTAKVVMCDAALPVEMQCIASLQTNTQFILHDIFGRNVMNKKMEKNEMVIERGNLAEGIYFYSITGNKEIIAAGKVLIVE